MFWGQNTSLLYGVALKTKDRLDMTQMKIAIMFYMGDTTYSDIETGVLICRTLTPSLACQLGRSLDNFKLNEELIK